MERTSYVPITVSRLCPPTLKNHFIFGNKTIKQVLSLQILQVIAAHCAFIAGQIGYHCTLTLGIASCLQLNDGLMLHCKLYHTIL